MRSSGHLAGERRVVTALFADVVDSTALAEQMDPEDWTLIMNRAFDLLVPAIYRYEGTIARFMGDALLAFFGAPVAHEDDPVRAVRAGWDLISIVREYAEEVRRQYGINFSMRVGLNTGPVVVGEVGSNLVYEYTAMGDAINLAARMQSAARPMTVLISENTHRFVAPIFDFQDLGAITVKGKSEPVRVFEVIGLRPKPGSLRGLSGLESPMVGRADELATLLDLARTVQAGVGRSGLLIGEAGIGKTRLINEWKAALLAEDVQLDWIEGHCLSYGQGLAYHLLIDLLRSILGVSAATSEPVVRTALQKRCDELFEGQTSGVYPYLAHLLSLHLEGDSLERVRLLGPQTIQAQYLFALREIFSRLASQRPTIFILEDIHWADPSSTELLIKLLPLAREVPILFIFLARPERETAGWRLVTNLRDLMGAGFIEITLRPLNETDSEKLVENLLDLDRLPAKIREIILSKAEGNPFFVEEVIRMLIDQGVLVNQDNKWVAQKDISSTEIPDNLQGLLLARIDRLPEDVKQTLRVASVIGRQFSVKVLEQVLARQKSNLS